MQYQSSEGTYFHQKKIVMLNVRTQQAVNSSEKLFLNIRIDSVNQILRDNESQINLECKFTDQNYRPEDSMCIFMFIK